MNKQELVCIAANQNNVSIELASELFDCILENIIKELKKGKVVRIVGFGKFEVRNRKAKNVRTLSANNKVKVIPERKAPFFSPSDKLKKAVNNYE